MKNMRTFNFLALFGLMAVLASCGSSGSITKRYHSRGYQISLDWLKKTHNVSSAPALMQPATKQPGLMQPALKQPAPIQPAQVKANPAHELPANQLGSKGMSVSTLSGNPEPPKACKAEIKAELAKVKTAVKSSAAEFKTVVHSGLASTGPLVAGIKPALEDAKPELKKAAAKVESVAKKVKMSDDMQIIAAIVALFLPFLGVYLYEGSITTHFWIALLLWILGILPGIVYAWLVIFGVIG
jgi:uncharacterized membrane protein YqaE (UPF0057 family)